MDSDDEFVEHSGAELEAEPQPRKPADNGYAWEDEYRRTWDLVADETELLQLLVQQMLEARKKRIMRNPQPFQRGIIRTLVVVIDGLATMAEKDLRPNRFAAMLQHLQQFVLEFFDQNPISQMGIVMMRNGVATVVSRVSGLPQEHLEKIRLLRSRHNKFEPKGDPLLQNGLELARLLLNANFGRRAARSSKEILVVFGALFTLDPGDIHKTILALVADEVRVKVIGLLAQVAICHEIVVKTNFGEKLRHQDAGQFYGVIMNDAHFQDLLTACVEPLAVHSEPLAGVPLLKMGFPSKSGALISTLSAAVTPNFPALCACHTLGEAAASGYQCPQCASRVCHLPAICPVCGLMLILSTHLARSYHHLVPLADYAAVPVLQSYDSTHCYGCLLQFSAGKDALTSSRYKCGRCSQDFCIDCDVFVHEVLHNCPGCENKF